MNALIQKIKTKFFDPVFLVLFPALTGKKSNNLALKITKKNTVFRHKIFYSIKAGSIPPSLPFLCLLTEIRRMTVNCRGQADFVFRKKNVKEDA